MAGLSRRSGAATASFPVAALALLLLAAPALAEEKVAICEKGGGGLVLPLIPNEHEWSKPARAFIYSILLGWCFLGVSIIADIFMSAIEAVTSKKRLYQVGGRNIPVAIWNPTIANLSLMALGSSAPEILLSLIELMGAGFYAGELGPSTIVGSAAFNLLVIIAVCVSVIPNGESRTIKRMAVYKVTASTSVFAYLWLVIILAIITPNVVDMWEGVLTFCFFPILLVVAYLADIGMFSGGASHAKLLEELRELHPNLTDKELNLLCKLTLPVENKSRAAHRVNASAGTPTGTRSVPGTDLSVGFMSPNFTFPEQPEDLVLEVEKTGTLAGSRRVIVEFATKAGSIQGVPAASCIPHHNGNKKVRLSTESFCDEGIIDRGYIDIPADSARGRVMVNWKPDPAGGGTTALEDGTEAKGGNMKFFTVHILQARALKPPIAGGGPGSSSRLSCAHSTWNHSKYNDPETLEEQVRARKLEKVHIVPEARNASVFIQQADEDSCGFGQLRFETFEIEHFASSDSTTTARIKVQRISGHEGEIVCKYFTEPDSARPVYDFTHTEGILVFACGAMEQAIEVPIIRKSQWEGADRFFVMLEDVEGKSKVVIDECDRCTVTIQGSKPEHRANAVACRIAQSLDYAVNIDAMRQGNDEWCDQFVMAMRPSADEESESDGVVSWTLHIIALPWKLLFACVPPTSYCGGWVRFFSALTVIGGVTALIGDVASLLGCCLGMPDSVTAITIVALGTSLPDTFASKVAAVEDSSADNAIGNVTGSNCVNVFLGLGLPWMFATFFWAANGATDEWTKRYPEEAKRYPGGAFVVQAGDLTFSVVIFIICELIALLVIAYRRRAFQAELGGPAGMKLNTSIFFVLLWVFYAGVASWKAVVGDEADITMMVVAVLVGFAGVFVGMVVVAGVVHVVQRRQQAANQQAKDLTDQVCNQIAVTAGCALQRGGAPACVSRDRFDKLDVRDVLVNITQQIETLTQTCNALKATMAVHEGGSYDHHDQSLAKLGNGTSHEPEASSLVKQTSKKTVKKTKAGDKKKVRPSEGRTSQTQAINEDAVGCMFETE